MIKKIRNIKISEVRNGVFLLLVLLSSVINAQTFNFRNFGTGSGIPDTYIYSISQDEKGFLWISTGNGLARFDGFSFYPVPYPDNVDTRYSTTLFRDSNGRIWAGCNDGSLFYTNANALVKVKDLGVQSINQIFESEDGYIFIIPQEKYIIRINPERPEEIIWYPAKQGIILTSAAFTGKEDLLIGTMENLLLCRLSDDSLKVTGTVEGIEYTKIQSILRLQNSNRYLVGTEGSGLYILEFKGKTPVLQRIITGMLPEDLDIRAMMESEDGSVWLSTMGKGLIKTSFREGSAVPESVIRFDMEGGLQGNDVRCSFQDDEGNLWAGLYGEGISLLVSEASWFVAPGVHPERNNIIYIRPSGKEYFIGTPTGYFTYSPDNSKSDKFNDLSQSINSEVSSYLYENGEIYAGTKGKGIYHVNRFGQVRQFFISENSGRNYIRHINSDMEYLWVSTLEGVVVLGKKDGRLAAKFNIDERLPHNSINQVFILNDGSALVATECDRLYRISLESGVSVGRRVMSGTNRNKVLCYTQDDKGDIWAGTEGNGIFWFTGDSLIRFTVSTGLFSNYCYSIFADSRGKIWIGHERGYSMVDPVNGQVRSFSTGFARNGNCNPFAIAEDPGGRVIIGTTEGIIIYDRSKDSGKNVIPRTSITGVTINNVKYPLRNEYSLPFGRYTIKIDFVGICLSDPGGVFYSTKMENWDERWSEPGSERQVPYTLSDGSYRFMVKSFNSRGQSDEVASVIEFNIRSPFWRTWWFILGSVLTISAIIFLILKERERAQARQKKYLEDELDKRTSEVVKQKEEIEQQNLEITDSINYAKRIQASILPDTHRLREFFSDAFVIFHPRDIVSGDFYWFDRLDEKRFMVVCADSTGHGVPGAFMSMIGSTLLQDIISRKGITRPSQILTLLDKQIISTLNQNVDIGVSNDGMDMVVCEINIPDRHIRFASAMRPVIIVMGGESYYIKGNRCSVGGESVIEKFFDDQEYYLGKGDSIYMFSDGFPDQFGGVDGKKMKIARLKTLIEDVQHLPMDQQKEIIDKFFFEWKGTYEQVDDVLMMGLRL